MGKHFIILNYPIWSIDGTLAVTIISDQRGAGSNGNKQVTPHSPKFENLSLTTGYSLLSYPDHTWILSGEWRVCRKRSGRIIDLTNNVR